MTDDTTDPVVAKALEWFVRMRDEQVNDADRDAFQAWLAQDPRHAAAWARAEALWDRFDIVRPEIERLQRPAAGRSRRNLLIGAAAAVGAGGLYALARPDLFADHVTGVGERRTFTLADGSTVELGSYSALSTAFTAERRQVELLRGEGFFSVVPDPARPFSVGAGGGTTRALGTRFDLKYVDELVTIAVEAHAVAVRAGAAPEVRIAQGWQVSYGRDGIGLPSKANLEAVAAWRRDRIMFQDVPLRRVLAELERYRRGRIVLMDRSVGDIPVTAVFDTRDAESALRTIADALSIRVLNATNYVAFVYRG